jgi:RimJ/RimL family protein N-acetyltransferase
MTEPRLRLATPADAAIIAEFNRAMALETEQRALDPDRLRAGVDAVFADPARGTYRVAEVDGTVAACLLVTFEWSDWRNGTWWWLQSVYVRPGQRGRGLFGALYRQLRADALATPGVCGLRLYVETKNAKAQRVYEALGMTPEPYRMLHDEFTGADAASARD